MYLVRLMSRAASESKPVHSRYSRLSQVWRTAKLIRIISAVSNWFRRHTSHELNSLKRVGKGGCRAQFTQIKIKNSRFTGIKTDFSQITHHSACTIIFHPYTPYSKMAAILVFVVFLPLPFLAVFASFLNSKFKIFSFNEATTANLQVTKEY